jgi:hypothetical protein
VYILSKCGDSVNLFPLLENKCRIRDAARDKTAARHGSCLPVNQFIRRIANGCTAYILYSIKQRAT